MLKLFKALLDFKQKSAALEQAEQELEYLLIKEGLKYDKEFQ